MYYEKHIMVSCIISTIIGVLWSYMYVVFFSLTTQLDTLGSKVLLQVILRKVLMVGQSMTGRKADEMITMAIINRNPNILNSPSKYDCVDATTTAL